jgi:hypothetical protein
MAELFDEKHMPAWTKGKTMSQVLKALYTGGDNHQPDYIPADYQTAAAYCLIEGMMYHMSVLKHWQHKISLDTTETAAKRELAKTIYEDMEQLHVRMRALIAKNRPPAPIHLTHAILHAAVSMLESNPIP